MNKGLIFFLAAILLAATPALRAAQDAGSSGETGGEFNDRAAAGIIGGLFSAQDISGVNESLEQLGNLDLGNRDLSEVAGKEIAQAKKQLLSAGTSAEVVGQIPFVQLMAKTAQLEALQSLLTDPADKQRAVEILKAYRARLPGSHPRLESAVDHIKLIAAGWAQAKDGLANGATAAPPRKSAKSYVRLYGMSQDTPFPDGVVNGDFFLKNYLPNRDRRLAAGMIDDLKIFDRLPELMLKLKKGPLTLSDGSVASLQKTPRFSNPKLRRVKFASLEDVVGPFLVIEKNGSATVAKVDEDYSLAAYRYDESQIDPHLPGRIYPTTEMTYDQIASLGVTDRFRDEVSFSSLETLAGALDSLSLDGSGRAKIAKEIAANAERKNQLIGEFIRRSGWAAKYRRMAGLVEKTGEQSFNDSDVTVSIGKVFKRLDPWHFGETVVKGRDSWLIVQNLAGVVSYAVRLKPLEKGILEMKIVPEREEPFDFKVSAGGKVTVEGGHESYYLGPIDFDLEYLLTELSGQLRKQDRLRHKGPNQ